MPTFSQILKDNGYNLDYVGKWHVDGKKDPTEYGFDRYCPNGKVPPDRVRPKPYIKPETAIKMEFPNGVYRASAATYLPKEHYHTWMLTDRGIDYIHDRSGQEEPFFFKD